MQCKPIMATINHHAAFGGSVDTPPYGKGGSVWHPWRFTEVPEGRRVYIEKLRLDFYAKVVPDINSMGTEAVAMWAVHVAPPTKRIWAPVVPVDLEGRQVPHEDPAAAADCVVWGQPPVHWRCPVYVPPTEYQVNQFLGEDHTIWFRHAMFGKIGKGAIQMETSGQVFARYSLV